MGGSSVGRGFLTLILGENGMQDKDFFFFPTKYFALTNFSGLLIDSHVGDAIQHNYIASYRTKK